MAYVVDPEVATVLTALASQRGALVSPKRGDVQALREQGSGALAFLATLVPPSSGVRTTSYAVTAMDGTSIALRWYTKQGSSPGPAVVYAHGGGMIMGDLDVYDAVISWYVAATGVPFLAVQYRLAPEVRGSTLAEDTFAGLAWLNKHAAARGVDPDRIAIMGDSGGGGPAAGAAILARNRHLPLARQILIYPMLDDRNVVPGALPEAVCTWTYDNNFTAWSAVLGDKLGSDTVSPIAAPARLKDFSGLAPAYIEVGDLDIFRDEDLAYAQRLAQAGCPIEFHVHPGVPHGFERFAPHSRVAQRALQDRARVIASL